jgi:hypothetical protein
VFYIFFNRILRNRTKSLVINEVSKNKFRLRSLARGVTMGPKTTAKIQHKIITSKNTIILQRNCNQHSLLNNRKKVFIKQKYDRLFKTKCNKTNKKLKSFFCFIEFLELKNSS